MDETEKVLLERYEPGKVSSLGHPTWAGGHGPGSVPRYKHALKHPGLL